MSIQDIRPNSQDTSNFYLANIYQVLADPNQPNISLPSLPPFSPPSYAVWVNALWFLSLVISLTCALLATLLQQWARRYLKVTQSRYAPHKRARIRAFLAEGVDKLLLPWTVETLPTLLHISLFLFFAGLVVFLWNVNLTNFKLVLSWVGVCTALYGCITVMPIFRHDSPYHTPLSLPAWHIVTGIQFLTFRALERLALFDYFSGVTYCRFRDLAGRYGKRLVQGMQKTVEETALNLPSEIDARVLLWTFDCLDEDHELEHFFSGLPGFRISEVIKDPFPTLGEEGKNSVFSAMTGLLDRTFSSDLLPDAVKRRRAIICTKAVDPADTPEAINVLNIILSKYQYGDPLVAEIAQIVRGWEIDMYEDTISHAKATFSETVARVQPRDDTWFILASKSLGVPEAVLRDYAVVGDSLSLAVLIHVTRQQFIHFWKFPWPRNDFSEVLEEASKFNVQDTSPELQHEFCALWNHIARKIRDDDAWSIAFYVLGRIRNVYMALHQGTDSAPTQFSPSTGDWDDILWEPSSYPVCNIPGHHPDSTPHFHDDSASATAATFVHAAPHDRENTAPVLSSLSSSPGTPFLIAHAPLCVNKNLADVLLLDNNISVSLSLQPVNQTATESRHIFATSPNPVTTRAAHGSIDPSTRKMRLSAPEPSSSFTPLPMSKASTSSLDAVPIQHTPISRTLSLDVSLPPPAQVLDDRLPMGPPLTSDTSITVSGRTREYHPSVPGSPGPSRPLLSSAPEVGAAAEREGSATAALRREMDAPYIMANPDLSPQSPSPAPIIGVAISSPSCLNAEHVGDHPPRASRGQYDIG